MPLTASNLSFGYRRGAPVLRGVTASFEAGTLAAIIGPNGSGKTTLLRLLLGLLAPTAGIVSLAGRAVRSMPEPERAARLAYAPQRPSVAFGFSVWDVVALGCARRAPAAESRSAVGAALEAVGLTDRADAPFVELSAGQQQRAVLARALAQLACSPAEGETALIADEPTSAMDPRHALEAMSLLRAQARLGRSVVLVLHDLTAAARFADRAMLLDHSGACVADGPAGEVLQSPVMRRVFEVEFAHIAGPGGELRAIVPAVPASAR
ncbi:MAG TPA: ABC transporter ATP-binding protein [Phycisphaerales bacterium]|nr:ABC transporter ATP-binding protein [Phycisphaerales bacterium]